MSNVTTHWTGVRWFVEGDIKGCFDNIDHDVLLSVLGEKLHDNRFLNLLKYLLKAGYMEDWKYGRTLSGTPQGSVVSPILANIYLDRLDKFVENVLIPAHTRGTDRRDNPAYTRLLNRMHYHQKVGHHSLATDLRKQSQQLPSRDPHDLGYRRLRYVRYADDFVLGFIGPKAEAKQVKDSLEMFLCDSLKLELSKEKTLITHATSQAARFLGYELVNQQANDQHDHRGQRPGPDAAPVTRTSFTPRSRRWWTWNLSGKAQVHRTEDAPPIQERRCNRARATCLPTGCQATGQRQASPRGAIRWHTPEKQRQAVLVDQQPQRYRTDRNELVKRLLADECEMCGSMVDVEVHHIRALRDLNVKGQREKPQWVQIMAARKRKTLVVCRTCHMDIHHGRSNPQTQT